MEEIKEFVEEGLGGLQLPWNYIWGLDFSCLPEKMQLWLWLGHRWWFPLKQGFGAASLQGQEGLWGGIQTPRNGFGTGSSSHSFG